MVYEPLRYRIEYRVYSVVVDSVRRRLKFPPLYFLLIRAGRDVLLAAVGVVDSVDDDSVGVGVSMVAEAVGGVLMGADVGVVETHAEAARTPAIGKTQRFICPGYVC